MQGGAIIGQGTYGCAVRPPFLCHGQARESRKDQAKVGKVTLASDAENEMEISKVLHKEKLWKNYFILVEDKECQPIKQKHLEDWSGCTIFKGHKPSELRQVTSPFGGKSFITLTNVELLSKNFNFFRFFNHLLEAGALLALNNVCHYDIHKSNILIDKYKVPRLIDFGMSFQGNKINTDVLNERWKVFDPQYDSEPPEITIITGVRKGNTLENTINLTVEKKPILKKNSLLFGASLKYRKVVLWKFFKSSKAFLNSDWVSFFKVYWPKFDAFAIGAILLNIFFIFRNEPSFTSDPFYNPKIIDIIGNLTDESPVWRYDCVEALASWNPGSVVLKKADAWILQRQTERKSLPKKPLIKHDIPPFS